MRRSPVALGISLVLFIGWVGFLGYLATKNRRPVVVSRAQLMSAQWVVVAEVVVGDKGKPSEETQVVAVIRGGDDAPAAGTRIRVVNLFMAQGFSQPGAYLLLLVPAGEGRFRIADAPRSPGYTPGWLSPRIYPWGEQLRRQLTEPASNPAGA
jgi:hypothetical protein